MVPAHGGVLARNGLPFQGQQRGLTSPTDDIFQLLLGTPQQIEFPPFSSTEPIVVSQVSTTWIGGPGNWNDPAKWSGGVVPNNGTPAGTTYNVFIDNGNVNFSTVTITTPVTIDSLNVSANDTLTINNGTSLTVVNSGAGTGVIANNGIIRLSGGPNFTDLIIDGDVYVSGNGAIHLFNGIKNRIYALSATDTLTNDGNTIHGSGNIGNNSLTLNNQGTIRANTFETLTIDPAGGGCINGGLIEALGASNTLVLNDGAFNNTGGTIFANSGKIEVNAGSLVTGGTVNVSSIPGSTLRMKGGSVTGGTLNNSGTILLETGTTSTIGGTINNQLSGLLPVDNATLSIPAMSALNNFGTVTIDTDAALTMDPSVTYTQTGSGSRTSVNGDLTGGQVNILGGVLFGNGTINAVLNNSARIRPGMFEFAPGILTLNGNYTHSTSGIFVAELNGSDSGVGYDSLHANGTINLEGGLELAGSFAPAIGDEFLIVQNDGTDAITGTFSGFPEAFTFDRNGQQFRISYVGGTGNDVVVTTLTAANQAPTVNAGSDQTITLPSTATLSGTASDDGLPNPPAILTTTWSKLSGPGTVTFGNPGSLNTTASFSQAGSYVLRLTANDTALIATDDVSITVNPQPNQAPTVNAGSDQIITLPSGTTLNATASDDGLPNPPATLTTTWSHFSGGSGGVAFGDPQSLNTTVSFTQPGVYVLRLRANDSAITSSDDVTITVNPEANQAPTVNAGLDQTITLPNSALLTGTASDDGFPNPPAALTFTWSKVGGPGAVTFGDAGSLNTTASFSQSGTYVLRLTANDGDLATSDDMWVSVNPELTQFTVSNNNNDGAGSLRQAVLNANASANPNVTIDFTPNVRGKIVLTSFSIVIYRPIGTNLTINGPGADVLSVETPLFMGPSFGVFRVDLGNIKISNLRISRGNEGGKFPGGGIQVLEGANLTLEGCTISENRGGAIATQSGSTLTINNSLIAGNEDFGIYGAGDLNISNSTVADNFLFNFAGIHWLNGAVSLTNVTVSGNRGFASGIAFNTSNATILNSTITNNGNVSPAGNVGGLQIENGATVNIKNTIIAKNLSSIVAEDVSGTVVSQGNNLIGDTRGSTGFTSADLRNVNPQLGGFANNGGATYTHSLRSTSPAINAGNNSGAPATDQRGVARPNGTTVDIGAYESGVRPTAFGKIVFVSERNGNPEIYSINADGTSTTRLTTNSGTDEFPDWSPDGSKIAFSTDRNGNFEIYTMNADGSALTRLTTNSVPDTEPAYSPDGTKIAFVRNGAGIFLMNTDGTNQSAVPNTTDGASPSWSPDGMRITFTCNNSGSAICKIDADGTNRTPFAFNDAIHTSPAWSPDGNSIAFSIDFDSSPLLYFYNPHNVEVVRPMFNASSGNEVIAYAPAFSPDGAKLAFGRPNLLLRDADGGNPVFLINSTINGNSSQPDWFGQNTLAGTNVSAAYGTTTVTFSGVFSGGTTNVVPIDPTTAGTVPGGYSLGAGFPAYEITTTATYSAPLTVCLQVPSVTVEATFNALTLFHSENGVLIDRTSSRDFPTRTICATVDSLSPFVVAEDLTPTAANVSVGGRVLTSDGIGISKVRISIADQSGETRRAMTNSFGYYNFDEVPAGQTYVIAASHKRYLFGPQVLTVTENITNLDFFAEAK